MKAIEELKRGMTALRLEVDASIVEALEKLIQQAKSEWCKQQRENCYKEFLETTKKSFINVDFFKDSILNAPEP